MNETTNDRFYRLMNELADCIDDMIDDDDIDSVDAIDSDIVNLRNAITKAR